MNSSALLEFVLRMTAQELDGRVARQDSRELGPSRLLEHGVAVTTRIEVVDDGDAVEAIGFQGTPADLDVHGVPATDRELGARDLRESTLPDTARDEVEELTQLPAFHRNHDDRVVEREHRVDVPDRDRSLGERRPDAAGVDERDIRVGRLEDRVGDEVAQRRIPLLEPGRAHAGRTLENGLVHLCGERVAEWTEHLDHRAVLPIVRPHREQRVGQPPDPVGADRHREPADPISPASGLHDRGPAVSVDGAVPDENGRPEVRVAVPAHDHVDSGHARGEGFVLVDADVGQGDDEVRLLSKLGDERRRDRDGIGHRDAVIPIPTHDPDDVLGREAEDRDLHAPHVEHDVGGGEVAKPGGAGDGDAADPPGVPSHRIGHGRKR